MGNVNVSVQQTLVTTTTLMAGVCYLAKDIC